MTRKLVSLAVAVVLICAAAPSLLAEGKGWAEKQRFENSPEGQAELERARANRRALPIDASAGGRIAAFGTIQYDNGIVNVAPTTTSRCWGNRFDTHAGGATLFPVQASGSITMASVYMVSASGGVFISIADQLNTGAGTAMNVTSFSTAGMVPGWNVQTFGPINYVGSSFLAGIWYFGGDVVGLGTGTNAGQGIHGMDINDSSGTLTGYTPSTTFNALFRPTGDLLTPLELLSCEIADEDAGE